MTRPARLVGLLGEWAVTIQDDQVQVGEFPLSPAEADALARYLTLAAGLARSGEGAEGSSRTSAAY